MSIPTEAPLHRVKGTDALRDKYGRWPTFHDSEILSVFIDRVGPSITLDILMTPVQDRHFKVSMKFHDIEDLHVADFNYQNVIASLTLSERTQKRFATGQMESRLFVEIDSVFGATCSLSCSEAEVLSVQETSLRVGYCDHR